MIRIVHVVKAVQVVQLLILGVGIQYIYTVIVSRMSMVVHDQLEQF